MKCAQRLFLVIVLISATLASFETIAATTTIFTDYVPSGDGFPYSVPVGTFDTPGVSFGTDTGFNWHPFSLSKFGADILGTLDVTTAATYTFMLNSDDGSSLFIDGIQIIDNGGAHGVTMKSGDATLAAGVHSFEVRFFEDFGGNSGVDLSLPTGVTFGLSVPDGSSTLAMLGSVSGLLGLWVRRVHASRSHCPSRGVTRR